MHVLPHSRRDQIAGRISQGLAVTAAALAMEFQVSEDAIRRDLRALSEEGLCRRVYGGALPLTLARPMAARLQDDQARKQLLAQTALMSLERDDFLFLDSGSTNFELARLLPADYGLTVATNSVDIAAALLNRSGLQLLMVGGTVDPTVGGCINAMALQQVQHMNIDRCFIGVCALSAVSGISVVDPADAAFKRAVLSVSRQRIAMVTADKLERRAPHRVAAIRHLDALIVEHDLPEQRLEELTRAHAALLRASAPALPGSLSR